MDLLEYQGKQLFAQYGIPVSPGEAVTTVDANQRQAAYLRQQQLWTQEVPSLPLFQRLSLALIAPKVNGPQPDALAPITWNIASWKRSP